MIHKRFLFASLILAPIALTAETDWRSGYNSRDSGLEEDYDTGRTERVYQQHQLETLRRAVPPRYVRVVDFDDYASSNRYIRKGILFTYADYRARHVYLSGDFNNWGRIPMKRNRIGVYYYVLPVREDVEGRPIESYRYKFLVDGIWEYDRTHANYSDDGLGGIISLFQLDQVDVNRLITVRILPDDEPNTERLVEFAIYLPEANNVSLVGDFNNWNPEHDLMVKGRDGIFRLRKRMRPGGYVYKYIADGKWILDTFNHETRYDPGIRELCSFLNIESAM